MITRDRQRCREYDRKRRAENPEKVRKEFFRSHIRRKYSLSEEDYGLLMSAQLGTCAICGITFSQKSMSDKPHVDHDHKSGKVRGLLCGFCNRGLGQFKDDRHLLMSAVEYLDRNR
jgi:Recombination endonuclease VII.